VAATAREHAASAPAQAPPYQGARRVVFWVVVAAAIGVVIMSVVEMLTTDPYEGEGWIGGPIQIVLAGGPLAAVAFGLRSTRRVVARRTAVASVVLASFVTLVLVMQLLDPNEIAADRLVQAGALLVYLAAFVVELPAFGGRWPADDSPIDGPTSV